MFFIFGINQDQKEIGNQGPIICAGCGAYGRYRIYMTYMCLSLFFIPVLKWGKKYYVEAACCHSLYELNPETGKRLARGEQAEIQPEDLTLIRRGNAFAYGGGYRNPVSQKYCPACGYETEEDFEFCPKCGSRLNEREV